VAALVWRFVLTTGTGSIFGFLVARQAYQSALLAPLFIVLSFGWGLAVFLIVQSTMYAWNGRHLDSPTIQQRMARLLGMFIAASLYLVAVYHLTNLYFARQGAFEAFILRDGGVYPAAVLGRLRGGWVRCCRWCCCSTRAWPASAPRWPRRRWWCWARWPGCSSSSSAGRPFRWRSSPAMSSAAASVMVPWRAYTPSLPECCWAWVGGRGLRADHGGRARARLHAAGRLRAAKRPGDMAGLLVSAAHKSSGKTTVSLGLCAALTHAGHGGAALQEGPGLHRPDVAGAGRRPALLQPRPLADGRRGAGRAASRSQPGADLALVEGNKGLYDGLALDGSNSNAALATRLGLPVLLVLDARGMTRGIAPLILGYQAFDRAIRIGGVILNRVGGSRHEGQAARGDRALHRRAGARRRGRRPQLAMTERHLGLMPCAEVAMRAPTVQRDRAHRRRAGGPARVRALAATAATLARACPRPAPARRPTVRIGIARDRAFGFYYPDDLAALQAAGAELVPIDTLHDTRCRPLDGLFIGGGFPEACMAELQANAALRTPLRSAIEAACRPMPSAAA
jgi:cobyrinic acid a,c-diamide synthase